MTMRLSDFDHHIHALILELGLDYFNRAKVESLERTQNGWTAVVAGQNNYKVVLSGDHDVNEWHCDCPYDHGPVCKHVAATMFALRKHRLTEFEDALKGLSEEDAKSLLRDHMLEHPTFAARILDALGK